MKINKQVGWGILIFIILILLQTTIVLGALNPTGATLSGSSSQTNFAGGQAFLLNCNENKSLYNITKDSGTVQNTCNNPLRAFIYNATGAGITPFDYANFSSGDVAYWERQSNLSCGVYYYVAIGSYCTSGLYTNKDGGFRADNVTDLKYTNRTYVNTFSSTDGVGNVFWDNVNSQNLISLGLRNTNTSTPSPPVNKITFLNQTPNNLTVLNSLDSNLSVVYNYNLTGLTQPRLNYSISGSQPCMQFENGTCILENNSYRTISNTTPATSDGNITFTIPNDLYFKYNSPINVSDYNQAHLSLNLINSNNLASTTLENISSIMTHNVLEIMSLSSNQALVYACNNSYDFASSISTNSNCAEIGRINKTNYNNTDGFRGHDLIIFTILNGKIGSSPVQVTNNMSFIVRGTSIGTTNVSYIPNQARTSTTKTSSNLGITFSSQNYTFDMELHQFLNAQINYNALGNYSGVINYTATRSDLFDLPLFLTPVIITNPLDSIQSSRFLNITWLNATSSGTVTSYNLTLLNSDISVNRTLSNSIGLNNSYYFDIYSQNLSVGTYYVNVIAYDNQGLNAMDRESFNLTRDSLLNLSVYDIITTNPVMPINLTLFNLNKSYSEVWNTSASNVLIDIVKGDSFNLSFDIPNYYLFDIIYQSSQLSFQSLNQSAYKSNSVSVNIYDETSLALITNASGFGNVNVTFISANGSFSFNTSTGTLFVSNISAGFYEVKFNAPLYNQRSYYITITDRSTQTLNAYLSQSAITLLLTYVNIETGELLEGCGIVIAKIINGSWTTVASGFTDITGRYQSSVSTNTNYRFSSTCNGYVDKTFNLNPVIFTSYTIKLTKQSSSGSLLDFTNVNVYISNTSFSNINNNYFAWQISSPSGQLENYAYSLYSQCKNITSYSGVNAYGGTSSVNFNLSCAGVMDYVTLKYNYTLSNGSIRSFSNTYGITGNVSGTNAFMKNKDNHYGMGLFERSLLVTLLVIVFVGLITKFSNIVSGLAGGLLLSSYLVYIGFVEWWLVAPTLLVGFVLITSWSQTR